ncbi:tRNA (adenosine(37)-N6)-threonylcarbamoyltransferase complex dimerization subunit type 1 TsaB [Mucilaginibacter sabulilitoris]|uniref:tRNA (Adenosine(37)-N6)-threonylcarbamoyltransferase complex dimerization subunit type 1 TsaB n=1 Tax=Mucilaginibacter sabulilitoris TaxID=1173583 RepID=A0ABZ0TXA6_9SPHI|nr:tRNA (adenosine(37)-N6)-threonylcarbamoyltransferase complex dimerization subunit type 1 TsaB [Mucilaginibacter sabulilitoris]WPU96788.1 tRNA (adenosine(37)-N6)-threonylcarbamoyltransferase complex dimerization subunit type 1 TsaB [Mucilaginibacter sabulilitoris]
MSVILQIETATTSCSVALAIDGTVAAFKQVNERNIHAEVITLFIDELLNTAGLTYNDLDAIAVSCGPGSYTGLRIGVSTAKGLCFALDKPLIAIETLEAMAYGILSDKAIAINSNTLLCPMIDARRMEVYCALFNHEGVMVRPTAADIIDDHSFSEFLNNHKILFFGDGADKCETVLGSNNNAQFLPAFVNSAVHLTQRAVEKFNNKEFEDVAYFEPYYLKDFIAGKKAL